MCRAGDFRFQAPATGPAAGAAAQPVTSTGPALQCLTAAMDGVDPASVTALKNRPGALRLRRSVLLLARSAVRDLLSRTRHNLFALFALSRRNLFALLPSAPRTTKESGDFADRMSNVILGTMSAVYVAAAVAALAAWSGIARWGAPRVSAPVDAPPPKAGVVVEEREPGAAAAPQEVTPVRVRPFGLPPALLRRFRWATDLARAL